VKMHEKINVPHCDEFENRTEICILEHPRYITTQLGFVISWEFPKYRFGIVDVEAHSTEFWDVKIIRAVVDFFAQRGIEVVDFVPKCYVQSSDNVYRLEVKEWLVKLAPKS